MYLKALEIQGFKSFADKTRLTFEKDITAIVGPNGSGKSTILKTIAGQLPRIGGAAYLDGEELRARSRLSLIHI